jgi:hypothetical protein
VIGLEETASSEDKGKTELCPDVLGAAASSGAIEDLVASPTSPPRCCELSGGRFSSRHPRGEAGVVRTPGGCTGPGADAARTPDARTIPGVDTGYRSKADYCLSWMGVMPFLETTSSWRNPALF